MPKSNEFAQFIDELRESRNISRESFVNNIISLRQYYRYIRGDSSLKDETINQLLERLEISSIHAYESFKKKQDTDYSNLINIYSLIHIGKFKEADEAFHKLEFLSVLSNSNMKLLEYIEIRLDLHFNRIDEVQAKLEVLEIMDYPNILKKESLSFIEVTCILFVSDSLIKDGDYRIADYGFKILKQENGDQYTEFKEQLLPLQLTVVKGLGKIGKYEDSVIMAKKAINDFETHHPLNILLALNYSKALSEREIYKDNRYLNTLVQVYSLCNIVKNKKLVTDIKKLITNVFDVRESDLIIYKNIKKIETY